MKILATALFIWLAHSIVGRDIIIILFIWLVHSRLIWPKMNTYLDSNYKEKLDQTRLISIESQPKKIVVVFMVVIGVVVIHVVLVVIHVVDPRNKPLKFG